MSARGSVLAAWGGALAATGGLAAPMLFRVLPERALAGLVAGELFRLITWVSIACALLAWGIPGARGAARSVERQLVFVPAALLAGNEWLLRPVLQAARVAGQVTPAFIAWHALSAALYGVATLVVAVLAWRERGGGLSPAARSG